MAGFSNSAVKSFSVGDPVTMPNTSNLICGNGQGGSVDSGISASNIQISRFFSAVTNASGVVTFYPTDDGTPTGNPLFSSIAYIGRDFPAGNPNYAAAAPIVAGDLKSITAQCFTQVFTGVVVLSINVLGSVTIGNSAAGITLTILVTGRSV